jgi:hypothetical protein
VRERHHLFHGELSDAPGRHESWDDYLRYRGNNRWQLIAEGTDFNGMTSAELIEESMSTGALVMWTLERDAERRESSLGVVEEDVEVDDDTPIRQFGPFGKRLREVAVVVGAPYCVSCLDGWLSGSWPPKKKLPAVRVLKINGVTKRGVWIGIYHRVFDVDTNLGPAFLYPPGADRAGKLVLKAESSSSAGRRAIVPKAFMAKLEALRPVLDALPNC